MRRSRTLWVTALASLSVAVSACGSDEPSPQATGATPIPSASATASGSVAPSTAPRNEPGLSSIALASTDPAGKPLEHGADQADLSGDGNVLAYRTPPEDARSEAKDSAPASILVRDLRGDSVVAACTSEKGEAANGACDSPSLSRDGRYVVFASEASNLSPDDRNAESDVFRKDLRSGEVVLISDGGKNEVSTSPTVSADGSTVAYLADGQVWVKDLTGDSVTLVSRTADGTPGDAESKGPKISADGSKVAFRSRAANLAGKPRHDGGDVLVATIGTGKIVKLEKLLRLRLPRSNFVGEYTAPSADGARIAYTVLDTAADDEDSEASTTNRAGVYVADLNKTTVIHTVRTKKSAIDREAGCARLSDDGKYLAYCTFRNARKATKGGDGFVVYLADLGGDNVAMMSGAVTGTQSPDARSEAISADGRVVIFRSDNPQRGVEAQITKSNRQYFVARPAL